VLQQGLQFVDGADRNVDLVDGSGLGVDTGRVQPRQDRHGEPCRAQL
jgi:hypothetical protein